MVGLLSHNLVFRIIAYFLPHSRIQILTTLFTAYLLKRDKDKKSENGVRI